MQNASVNRCRSARQLARTRARTCSRVSLKVSAVQIDSSVRVKGSIKHVYNYVSSYRNLGDWRPEVKTLQCTRGDGKPLAVRHQYQVGQELAGFQVDTVYEVTEMTLGKSICYAFGSELHQGTEQMVFMQDPNDPTNYTIIRYIALVELSQWRKALTPMVSGVLKQLNEKSMLQLQALLSSPNSPVAEAEAMDTEHQAAQKRQQGFFQNILNGWKMPFQQATDASKQQQQQQQQQRRTTGSTRVSTASSKPAPPPAPPVDALGYYASLGLDGQQWRKLTDDDIKSAWRKAALTRHPDRFSTSDDEERLAAEEDFKKVQKAYEILRNPESRKKYNEGKLVELEEEAAV